MDDAIIIERLRDFFRSRSDGIACGYLFGSVARGDSRGDSDLDVAVLLLQDPPPTLEGSGVRLEGELEQALGRPVDVVILNRAPVDLVRRVLVDGILVFEPDRAARVRFEVRSRNEYFDLRPFLDRYRRAGESARG